MLPSFVVIVLSLLCGKSPYWSIGLNFGKQERKLVLMKSETTHSSIECPTAGSALRLGFSRLPAGTWQESASLTQVYT